MRRLVNAYSGWFGRKLDGDAFDVFVGFGAILANLAVGIVALLFVVFFALSLLVGPPAPHGSCRYQHWMGKAYACDEYYPLPQTVHP